MENRKILIIENDAILRRILVMTLQRYGATVKDTGDGQVGLRLFFEFRPDLVLTSLSLPGRQGRELVAQIRRLADTPIAVMTTEEREESLLEAYAMGVDIVVSKPVSPKLLAVRIRAVLQRSQPEPERELMPTYSDDQISIDMDARQVMVGNRLVRLTPTEYRILRLLLLNAGQTMSYRDILRKVWGEGYDRNTEYVHTYISRLRNKVEPDANNPRYLLSDWGIGYRFRTKIAERSVPAAAPH